MSDFTPMRYRCSLPQTCYLRQHVVRFDAFKECLPGRISFSDLDAVVEVGGNFFGMEWKSSPGAVPTGQDIMFRRMTNGGRWTIAFVAGDIPSMTVTHYMLVYNGKRGDWVPATLSELKDLVKRWAGWAEGQPRIAERRATQTEVAV